MADELTPTKALVLLQEAARSDDMLKRAMAAMASRAGASSFAEFARENPDVVVSMAESMVDLDANDAIGMQRIEEIRRATQT